VQTAVNSKPTKVYLETFGCQANQLESIHLSRLLREGAFDLTESVADADVILFNTCSVRQHAEEKVFSRLGRLASWKQGKTGRVLGILGCMAVEHKAHLLDRIPHLDVVLGPDQYPKVADVLRRAAASVGPSVLADFDPVYFPENDPKAMGLDHRAFVEIVKGCDKFCTFCIVPFTRGREVSRDPEAVVEEVRQLVDSGVQEITLLGQNVNSYGLGLKRTGLSPTFPQLLRRVAAVEGLRRLRFMTPHPLDLSDDLAAAFADTPNLCPYIHLPLQSGSDRVLKRMNRKYTAAHYLDRVRVLRQARPDLAFSTDLIVGFPGETDADFNETLCLMEEVRYDFYFSFKYSPRVGTPGARMIDPVPEEAKEERLALLNEKANRLAAERARTRIGMVEEVLVDGEAERTPGSLYGKSAHGRVVVFPAEGRHRGDFVMVEIQEIRVANLLGKVVE
jgi:tRNA-2-methylthio-N6-dimethylallyladenosine synthase